MIVNTRDPIPVSAEQNFPIHNRHSLQQGTQISWHSTAETADDFDLNGCCQIQ